MLTISIDFSQILADTDKAIEKSVEDFKKMYPGEDNKMEEAAGLAKAVCLCMLRSYHQQLNDLLSTISN